MKFMLALVAVFVTVNAQTMMPYKYMNKMDKMNMGTHMMPWMMTNEITGDMDTMMDTMYPYMTTMKTPYSKKMMYEMVMMPKIMSMMNNEDHECGMECKLMKMMIMKKMMTMGNMHTMDMMMPMEKVMDMMTMTGNKCPTKEMMPMFCKMMFSPFTTMPMGTMMGKYDGVGTHNTMMTDMMTKMMTEYMLECPYKEMLPMVCTMVNKMTMNKMSPIMNMLMNKPDMMSMMTMNKMSPIMSMLMHKPEMMTMMPAMTNTMSYDEPRMDMMNKW